jgi:sigma-B regulation protein RsbU (phosphoserine phosphatase)
MLSYATAGHNGAFLHHQSGEVSWLKNPGLPLGFSVSTAYGSVNIAVSPGDRLYFFSDGLYELPAPTGELWGQARLEEAVRELGHRPLAEVIDRTVEKATQWLGHERFPDDAAMIGLNISV